MASASQVAVGTTAVLLCQAPFAGLFGGPIGWYSLSNSTGGAVFIGSSGVGTANGYSLGTSSTLQGYLFSGDSLWARTSSGNSTVSVLVNGA